MATPSFLKPDSLARLLQGGAVGAIAAMVVGFNWGGWTLGSTAVRDANAQSELAVVSALAPICVDRFQASADTVANLAALNEASSYQRTAFIEKGGWAILPGSDKAGDGVAKACGKILTET